MRSSIARWGNSLALRIPKSMAEELGLTDGDSVEIERQADQLVVRKGKPHLADLVGQMNTANLHDESDWGSLAGNEVW